MFYHQFRISDEYPMASLTAYVCEPVPKNDPRPAVIICPGGGYGMLSPREAEPIVRRFWGEGFNCYLLEYSIGERAKGYEPLIEAALAVKFVRQRSTEDNTDPTKIFILGFSAGGHLAASAGTLWNIPEVRAAVGVTDGSAPEGINRPDGMILCYPVITVGKFTHKGTAMRVTGHEIPTDDDIKRFSIEQNVDATTPPAFIWHTFSDRSVSVRNTLLFANAMTEAGVPFECHIFPKGDHGLGLCNAETCEGQENLIVPHAQIWSDLAVRWIREFK